MTTETVQQQIDFIELQLKKVLDLIDIVKRSYCIGELSNALSSDDNIKLLIESNTEVSKNHENALVDIENFTLKDLHHIRHKTYEK